MHFSDAVYASSRNATGEIIEFTRLFVDSEKPRVDAIQDALIGTSTKEARSILKRLLQILDDNMIITKPDIT